MFAPAATSAGPEVGAVGVDGDDRDVAPARPASSPFERSISALMRRAGIRRPSSVLVVVRRGRDDLAAGVVPQTGQTRCGRRGLWHCGQALKTGAAILCWARRCAVRAWDCFCLGTAMAAEG